MIENPSEELNRLIHDEIIQYGEKLKQDLNPLMAENMHLKTQVLELKKQVESKSRSTQERPRVTTTPATLFVSAQFKR